MWPILKEKFKGLPSQLKVAQTLLQLGLSIRKGLDGVYQIHCGDIEMSAGQVSRAVNVDRRVVIGAVNHIAGDPQLLAFFSDLVPVANLGVSSSKMGLGVIQIIPELQDRPGIIASALSIVAMRGINVRQVIADDPEMTDKPTAIIVTDRPIPAELLPEMRKINGVAAVQLM